MELSTQTRLFKTEQFWRDVLTRRINRFTDNSNSLKKSGATHPLAPFRDVRFGSKADMCSAKANVR
jgi:hypothetical protein